MTSSFFEQLAQLNAVLSSHLSTQEKYVRIQPLIRDEDVAREFWNLLDDETWLPVLRGAGVFAHPPAPEQLPGGGVRVPYWGASRYLARVADRSPNEVATVFAELETETISIIGDMLDAAKLMPIQAASKLVGAVQRAAKAGALWVHFRSATELCVRLANEGRPEQALLLADALFAPRPRTEGRGRSGDDHWHKEGLRKITPILAIQSARPFLDLLSDWLEDWIRLTKTVSEGSTDDYSYIWRPAIEQHEQNHDSDIVSVVVECVREGFERAIADGRISLDEALELLSQRPFTVFQRLLIHLLTAFGEQRPALVARAILTRDLFDDHATKHEYARLVSNHFAKLDSSAQEEWLEWIDEGPDLIGFEEGFKSRLSREATEEERQSRIDHWKFEKLHWIRDSLVGARREFYRRMIAEHGTPEMSDLSFRISAGWVDEHLIAIDELDGKTFEEVLDWMGAWQPDKRDRRFGVMNVVSTFRDYVSKNPEELSRKALSLKGRAPSYVSAYVRQMSDSIKAGHEIDLVSVVELCRWVLQASGEQWLEAKDEVSDLVKAVCAATRDKRPRFQMADLREPLWDLVRVLYRASAKSYIIRDTSEDDLRLHDYLDLGINSARGKAVEAGLDFGRWVALQIADENAHAVPGGFDAIPEVVELLEWQMDPANQSLEAMAIIGSRIGVIHWIDAVWLRKNADRLFALQTIESKPESAFGWAAWNAFVVWVRPHVVFYRALERQFRYAVRQAALVPEVDTDHDQPMFRLGEHLMVLYGRGDLTLDQDVVQDFLSNAHSAVRRHAIGFVGSGFGHDKSVPSAVRDRFMALWEFYWPRRGTLDAKAQPDDVLFGSWFASGEFPDRWAIDCLREFVEIAPVPEPEHFVAERLAKIADADTLKSVEILNRMVRGDKDGWRIYGWQESVKVVLEKAIAAKGSAEAVASEVIDYLGRRGFVAFGALLARIS